MKSRKLKYLKTYRKRKTQKRHRRKTNKKPKFNKRKSRHNRHRKRKRRMTQNNKKQKGGNATQLAYEIADTVISDLIKNLPNYLRDRNDENRVRDFLQNNETRNAFAKFIQDKINSGDSPENILYNLTELNTMYLEMDILDPLNDGKSEEDVRETMFNELFYTSDADRELDRRKKLEEESDRYDHDYNRAFGF
jgi:hypothetical protein